MCRYFGNDDFDIDERTGDFNIFSESYGYERLNERDDEIDVDVNDSLDSD